MTSDAWVLIVLASLVSMALGGWVAWRAARSRHARRLHAAIDEVHQKYAAAVDQMRAAQVRAQTELEQARHDFQRQLAAAADGPRAAAARAEERLRAVHEELDGIRRSTNGPQTRNSELSDGFAATQPMSEGL